MRNIFKGVPLENFPFDCSESGMSNTSRLKRQEMFYFKQSKSISSNSRNDNQNNKNPWELYGKRVFIGVRKYRYIHNTTCFSICITGIQKKAKEYAEVLTMPMTSILLVFMLFTWNCPDVKEPDRKQMATVVLSVKWDNVKQWPYAKVHC